MGVFSDLTSFLSYRFPPSSRICARPKSFCVFTPLLFYWIGSSSFLNAALRRFLSSFHLKSLSLRKNSTRRKYSGFLFSFLFIVLFVSFSCDLVKKKISMLSFRVKFLFLFLFKDNTCTNPVLVKKALLSNRIACQFTSRWRCNRFKWSWSHKWL